MFLNLTKAKIFLFSGLAVIAGIALASFLPTEILRHDIWWFGGAVGLAVIIVILPKAAKPKAAQRLAAFWLLFFILGIWRYSITIPEIKSDNISYYNGERVEFIGSVAREPDVRIYNQKITVASRCIAAEGDSSECRLSINGNVLVTAGLYPKFNYGDELKIKCELQTPEPFDEFAYDRYLARYGIYSLCYRPQMETAEARPVASFRQKIYGQILQIKNKIKNSINYGLPEPESSLLQAIILGNRRGLDENLLNTFSRAGISHIIAISGMHIAIISVIIMRLLLRVGASRRWSFVFSVIFLALYIMLIGIPASALRAGLMVFMVLLATELGRLSKAVNSLIFAAVILLTINPLYLRDDIGFQLSFLAVLSILYIYPILNSYLDKIKIPKLKGARDIFTVTMAAQVLTLPLIALYFHQVSVISPLVNIVVLFLLPFVISGGMAASLLGMIFKDLTWLIFTPVYFVLKYIIVISEKFVSLPFAYLQIDYIWPGWVIIFYIIITWLIFKYSKIGSRVDV